MGNYVSPGVYVEEFDSGVKPMEGVSTSNAGFIGQCERGPVIGKPQLVISMAQFKEIYGNPLDSSYEDGRFLYYGVEQFFNNGGSTCYVMRVASSSDTSAAIRIGEEEKESEEAKVPSVSSLTFTAKNPGTWGNNVRVSIKECAGLGSNIVAIVDEEQFLYKMKDVSLYHVGDLVKMDYVLKEMIEDKEVETAIKFNTSILEINANESIVKVGLKIPEKAVDNGLLPKFFLTVINYHLDISTLDMNESFQISMNPNSLNYVEHIIDDSSILINAKVLKKLAINVEEEYAFKDLLLKDSPYTLHGGTTSVLAKDDYYGKDDGPQKRTGMEAFKERDDVSIMLMPGITDPEIQLHLVAHCENMKSRFAIIDAPMDNVKVDDLTTSRSYFDTSFGALYHPWILMYDPLLKRTVPMPPSGSVAGVYARGDNSRGVHKAPANEIVKNATALKTNYNETEQGLLNPKGINLIRTLPGMGIRVWGARTMSSDGSWKYVNVRRLFIYVEESIKANMQWAVFESNDEVLWARVSGTIIMFLTTCWKNGMLMGNAPEDAFYVRCGKNTMSQDDILNGRLICEIGIAPVRPAEFVIFRITQKMQESE